jgi:superfamily II DNA or RNA helicase
MTEYRYIEKHPDKAYLTNNLLLPKRFINTQVIKAALTFFLKEEESILNEVGQEIGVRQKTLPLWDETEHHLVVPREFLPPEQYEEFGCEFVNVPPPNFETVRIDDRIDLRDQEQQAAYSALIHNHSGTLSLSCGKGKTVIALKAAATLKVPTLVVVNTTALLEQWKEEIQRHLGVASVGVLQGTTHDWEHHPIVLAMVHTLSGRVGSWPQAFRKRFGLVLYDEGHHMSAPVFVLSADLFFGRRFSLTATASRTDGLEAIYQYHLGKVIHHNLTQDLIPSTVFHVLKWSMPPEHKKFVEDRNGDVSLPRMRTYLGRIQWRNDLIYERLVKDLQDGRNILVLSHSVHHVEHLHDYLSAAGAGMITGSTSQDSRMAVLRNGNPVFGTFQLAREGLNKPSLDTLYITTPFSNANDLQQAWGRIQRQFAGKKDPLVRVFEDTAFSACTKSCGALRAVLRRFNYPYSKEAQEIT